MTRVIPVLFAMVALLAGTASGGEPSTFFRRNVQKTIRPVSFGPTLAAPGELTAIPSPSPERIARVPEPRFFSPRLVSAPAGTAPAPDPSLFPEPIPAPEPPGSHAGPGHDPLVESPVVEGPSVTLLYPYVKYHDLHHVHPCAVAIVVAVPHPCENCGCAFVRICVPPHCQPRIKHKRHEIEYDYGGGYEVEIKWRDGVIYVDYDD